MDPRLFTAVIVVVGVPAVLVGYIYATELGLRFAPDAGGTASGPGSGLRRRCSCSAVFLILPTIGDDRPQLPEQRRQEFIGLDNYIWFFGSERRAHRPAQQRPLGGLPDAVRRSGSGCSSRSSSTASATSPSPSP